MKIRDIQYEKASRKDFAKVGDFIEMPNLIKVQKDSYDWFVEEGLGEVLKDISPIEDYSWIFWLPHGRQNKIFNWRSKRERRNIFYKITRKSKIN